jgi:hypothetical protein
VEHVAATEPRDRRDEAALPEPRRNGIRPVHPGSAGEGTGDDQKGEKKLGIHAELLKAWLQEKL